MNFVKQYYGIIIAVLVVLALFPDPTDFIDAGTPIAELIGAAATLFYAKVHK